MVSRAAFILLPLVALAQGSGPTPPPEVDEALRSRVTEFFQIHVDGKNPRKALDYVAEDTKDFYFAAQKMQLKSFKIEYIKYSADFTKAEVQTTAERRWRIRADLPESTSIVPMSTTWKIEDGKWVWYRDPTAEVWATPMGPSTPLKTNPNEEKKMPDVSPAALEKAAKALLNQATVDKTSITFVTDKAASDQVVFHNGYPGSVRIDLGQGSRPPGLKVELNKNNVNAGEDAVLKIEYEPIDKGPKTPVTIQLMLEPFNTRFAITVTFAEPEAAKQ
jgi:hypothetical protein